MSPETGDEFRVDDVVGGSKRVVYTFSLLQVCNTLVEKTCLVVPWKVETMSESDDMLSSVNSNTIPAGYSCVASRSFLFVYCSTAADLLARPGNCVFSG